MALLAWRIDHIAPTVFYLRGENNSDRVTVHVCYVDTGFRNQGAKKAIDQQPVGLFVAPTISQS